MYIDFLDLFSTRGERTIAKHLIRIKDILIPPGVALQGLDLRPYADKLLDVELQGDVYVVRGYYTFHPLTEAGNH